MEGFTKGRVDYLISQEEVRIKERQKKRFAPERRLCDYQLVKPPRPQAHSPALFRRMVARLRWRRYGEPLH